MIENNVRGIHLTSSKSQLNEDSGETSHFDAQLVLSEIHVLFCCKTSFMDLNLLFGWLIDYPVVIFQLLTEDATAVFEIMKVAVVTTLDVPMEVSY